MWAVSAPLKTLKKMKRKSMRKRKQRKKKIKVCSETNGVSQPNDRPIDYPALPAVETSTAATSNESNSKADV